jgi:GT2 family glycosyltransferase
MLTMKMYARDCDALLMIDHDVCFPHDVIERMVAAMEQTGVGVVAGNLALQLHADTTGFHADDETEGIHHAVHRAPGAPSALVDTIASSCVLVHRRVFDKISAHHGKPTRTGPPWFGPGTWWMLSPVWDDKQQAWIERGEDFSFSWRAREVGEAPMLLLWDLGLEHFKVARLQAPEPAVEEVPA